MDMKKVLVLVTFFTACMAFGQTTVPSTFWGVMFNRPNDPYPITGAPSFGTIRLWDTNTAWGDIQGNNGIKGCTQSSQFDFSYLDNYANHYITPSNFDVIYTVGQTPCFITSNPSDEKCAHYPGSCVPPTDLTCSGTGTAGTGGTDATFIAFVQALWTHLQGQPYYPGRKWFFEGWNEPDVGKFWDNDWINTTYCGGDVTGSKRILMRMAADARAAVQAIDPNVLMLTPPSAEARTSTLPGGWWYNYMGGQTSKYGGGGQYADIISVHGYVSDVPAAPELICCGTGTLVANTRAAMADFGQSDKILFLSEGSCGKACYGDPEPAWMGRFYTLMLSQGQVSRFDWNGWDTLAPLWNGTALTSSGIALQVMQSDWGYAGATFPAAGCTSTPEPSCTGAGNIWTCDLTEGGTGTKAQTAWYDSQGNSCSFTPTGSGWIDYKNLAGKKITYSHGAVKLTNSPILFEQ
jgi:hypothetical protein